ncbi:PREDICTED: cinnamoyl-CoA reductase 1-like isoform X2 [Nelumbo nucifera]|uniref:Cinnamoyl-CoA reductase 1-like isoform X2 n=1 Tax=Nelumbo nucifera TaxID=4432 RepID=A0A1U8Q7Q5_NELNU|nr:PREDICTED: cinnamoyl-CoA reductase 1-like isoform X2 [Nelumbo nucifera]
MAEKGRVCVTGAGGFLGSWVVKFLLSRGYEVHGTVRDPGHEKNAHLKKLEHAALNLHLFKADLLDYDSLCAAIAGCKGVFHVASPVPLGTVSNPEVELIEPAASGTHNVLKACSKEKVHKVVVVSSISAVYKNPNWPKNQVMDEMCWSDKEYCKEIKNFYCLSKTLAESQALEYAKQNGLNIVTVCPGLVLGPILQPTINFSSLVLINLLKDVRDVAEALLLAYEKPEAEGRYICLAYTIRTKDLIEKLRIMYPDYNYPKNFEEIMAEETYSSEKLQKLGWKYRPLEETLSDSVRSYQEAGILDKH